MLKSNSSWINASPQQQQMFCIENISNTIGLLQQNEESTQIHEILVIP